jgi:transposase
MERIWHHIKPAKRGPPIKLMDQARRALIREATKRPKITLKELQSFTAEIGVSVHGTTLSHIHSTELGFK